MISYLINYIVNYRHAKHIWWFHALAYFHIGYDISIILVCICCTVLFNRVYEMFVSFAVLVSGLFDFHLIYMCSAFSNIYYTTSI